MAPVESVAPLSQALQQYRYATGRETAALYEAACKAGAVCGALESELVKTVGSYGYELGMALAIVRDVQQLRSRKPQTNLRITLPLIYAADESYPFSKRVSSAMLSEEQHAAILVETLQLGGDMRALADAQLHVEQACVALIDLPDSSARDELEALARSVVMEF